MKTFTATIAGTSPLLQHRFTEDSQVERATRKVLVARGTPREEADKVCYRDPQGRYYIPGPAISRLLREAGANHKLKGSRRSARFIVPAAVLVLEDTLTLCDGDGNTPIESFEVDSRPVQIPATRGRVMRHRPRFDSWSTSFNLRINDTILPPDFVNQLLVEGGQQIGVGDFRPERGGPFGCFQLTRWEETQ